MRFLTTLVAVLIFGTSYSQTAKSNMDEFYPYKNELGINFTNVLGNVLSLNPNNANSPYGLTYRRHYGRKSFRSGLNLSLRNGAKDDFSGGVLTRNLNESSTQVRVGVEYHMPLSRAFQFSWGIDVLGSYENEKSEIVDLISSGSSFLSHNWLAGAGIGPVFRLEAKLSDRMYLSTESTIYGTYHYGKDNTTINGTTISESKKEWNLELVLPQSLFFNVSF